MPVTPLTVIVDAWDLSGASRNRGIGTYLREVFRGLGAEDDLDVRALTLDPAVLPAGISPVPIRRVAPGRFRTWEHEHRLPRDLRRAGGDVVWSPAQDPPRRSRVPFVQTLLDATPMLRSEPEHAAGAARMRRLAPCYRAAAGWVAISHYTADTCAELLDLPRDRIDVVHLGVSDRYRPDPSARRSPAAAAEDPAAPYILYVGEYGPHKGFAEAFAVVAELARRGLPHRLRMVGLVAPHWRPQIDALLRDAERPDLVDITGYVDDDDLVAMYQGASVLVASSRHEGFGLPLVEAMACATPVVAFANSSLPEVTADGGAVVPDGDVQAMADAAGSLLTDDRTWHDASARALARARAFDWRTAAAAHAAILRRAGRG